MSGFFQDKVVVVTGASSGIGRALSLEMGSRGAKIFLAARGEAELKKLSSLMQEKGVNCKYKVTDVSKEEDCKAMVEACLEKFGKIDVLINNAGISMRAIFEDVDLDVFRKLMDVNFYGAVYCTKYALPQLLKNKGTVVGISSIAGYLGLPARTAYSASKSALHGFLNALRTENRKTGLNVLLACPGYTESNIRKSALNADGKSQDESPLNEQKIMSAETVAIHVANAIQAKKKKLLLTTEGKMSVFLSKFFPDFIDGMVFKKVTSEPGSPIRLK